MKKSEKSNPESKTESRSASFRTAVLESVRENSLYYKIMAFVTAGIVITAVLVMLITAKIMQQHFIRIYRDETRLLMQQIQENYADLHRDVSKVMAICPASTACTAYLTNEDLNNSESSSILYAMNQNYKDTILLNNATSSTLLIASVNGRTFLNNAVTKKLDAYEIWQTDLVKEALKSAERTTYHYVDQPFLSNMENNDSFAAVKFLKDVSGEIYAVEILFIDLQAFTKYYDTIIDKEVILVEVLTNDGMVISSNAPSLINTSQEQILFYIHAASNRTLTYDNQNNGTETLLYEDMGYFGCYLAAILHHNIFYQQSVEWPILITTVSAVLIFTCLLVYYIIRRSMKPVQNLIEKMGVIRDEGFDSPIEVKGDGEIRRLAISYNYMLEDINAYVDELMDLEVQKQLATIHALQMQINPHFMYNTLTSFKFLVWQKKDQQLIEALDAFISLLRVTLHAQEQSSVCDEIENLKNYVSILQIRYGDHIQMFCQIDPDVQNCMIPTMILQPFVENSFYHAFPDNQNGIIQVFGRRRNNILILEVMDNGKGIQDPDPASFTRLNSQSENRTGTENKPGTENRTGTGNQTRAENKAGESFSGIGIRNVDERIKLLFGSHYGVKISSMPDSGTIVTIRLPVIPAGSLEELNAESNKEPGKESSTEQYADPGE